MTCIETGTAITCPTCKGARTVPDYRVASITHKRTDIQRICQPCKGTGSITPTDLTTAVREALWGEVGEIPDWMLSLDDSEVSDE